MPRALDDGERPIHVSKLGISDSTGKMLFMNVYYDVYLRLGVTAVAPENGPASNRMFEELEPYYSASWGLAGMMEEQLVRRFPGGPSDLLEPIQRQPDPHCRLSICSVLDTPLSPRTSD